MTTVHSGVRKQGPTKTPAPAATKAPDYTGLARDAHKAGLRVIVSGAQGNVVIKGADLIKAAADPSYLSKPTAKGGLGIKVDISDLFAAVKSAGRRGQRNTVVDLTRANGNLKAYDGITDNLQISSGQGKAEVRHDPVGKDAFRVRGQPVQAQRESIWSKILDVLKEIVSLGVWDTALFNGKIDDPEAWSSGAASIGMTGGSALRQELTALDKQQPAKPKADPPLVSGGERRLRQIVEQANPQLSKSQVRSHAKAIYGQLRALYTSKGITDARLDTLQRAYAAGGRKAFGGDPGAWLREHVGATKAGVARGLLANDIKKAGSPAEVQALLGWHSPKFSTLDAPTQVRLAQQVFATRQQPSRQAALSKLMADPDFAALAPLIREELLKAIAETGNNHNAVLTGIGLGHAVSKLPKKVKDKVADTMRSFSAITPAEKRGVARGRAAAIASSKEFQALPQAVQLQFAAKLKQAAKHLQRFRALQQLATSPSFAKLAKPPMNDIATMNAAVATVAATPSAVGRNALVALVNAPGFVALKPEQRKNALAAAKLIKGAAAQKSLLSLVRSKGLARLTSKQQTLVWKALGDADLALQQKFGGFPEFFSSITAAKPPLSAAATSKALNSLLGLSSTEIATGLPKLFAGLARMTKPAQSMLNSIGSNRSPAYLAQVQMLLGRAPLRDAPKDVQEVMLRALARKTPRPTDAQVAALAAHVNSPGFRKLGGPIPPSTRAKRTGLQRASLATEIAKIATAANPATKAAMTAMLADPAFVALPAAQKEILLAQVVNSPNPTAIKNLQLMAAAPWFKAPTAIAAIPAVAGSVGPPVVAARPAGPAYNAVQQQRAMAKIVAHMATQADGASGSQKTLINNTLGRFLPHGPQSYTLRMNWFADKGREVTFGTASRGTLRLNIGHVPTGNRPLAVGSDWKSTTDWATVKIATNTTTHEVNHLTNGDVVTRTHQYFMGEYGAWYAGESAQNGRPPTQKQCFNRAMYFFESTKGPYRRIRQALLQTINVPAAPGVPAHKETSPEARKVLAFMAPFAPSPPGPLTAGTPKYQRWIRNPASAQAIIGPPPWSSGHLSTTVAGPPPNAPGPVGASRDMNNSAVGPVYPSGAPAIDVHPTTERPEGTNPARFARDW